LRFGGTIPGKNPLTEDGVITMTNRFACLSRAAIGAAALTLGAFGIAGAQTDPMATIPNPPAPAAPPAATPPTYATASADEQITGQISAIPGKYALTIRDTRGFLSNVSLHQGTIINPTGLKLQTGMRVTIHGTNAGATFAANEIDTPYTVALVQPVGAAYGFGYGVGFGYGPGWGWGPRYRAGFWW
jgi:hypothetical protein